MFGKTPLASLYRARTTAGNSVRRLLLASKQDVVVDWGQWRWSVQGQIGELFWN